MILFLCAWFSSEVTARNLTVVVNESFRGRTIENLKQLHARYDLVFNDFQSQVCLPGDTEKFKDLFKKFRSEGMFIPLKDEKLNKESLKIGIRIWKEKIKWLNQTIQKLNSASTLENPGPILNELKSLIDENLKLQYQIAQNNKDNNETHLVNISKTQIALFKEKYQQLEMAIFYLLNFQYPVDHLLNREQFEKLKTAGENTDEVYMLRKITEDGALDRDRGQSDMFLRAVLDTFRLAMDNQALFFDRKFRADFDYLMGALLRYYGQSKSVITDRLVDWLNRSKKTVDFYEVLLKDSKKSTEVLGNFSQATQDLQSFVTEKLAHTYQFWSSQPDELKMIFVMETILFHEVGPLDPLDIEKSWVGQVVMNRINKKGYEHLNPKEELTKNLVSKGINPLDLWLNVLFRKGEFSFTYFFLPSAAKIFCTETLPSSKKLRVQNIRLSMHLLRFADEPDRLTTAERYFSRVSMLGRMDMTRIWNNYVAVEERPGKSVTPNLEQVKCIQQGVDCFRYLYDFFWQNEHYFVIEIKGNRFVWRQYLGRNYLWTVRDPDLFQFFRPLT